RGRLSAHGVSLIVPGLDQRLTDVEARVAFAPGRIVLRGLRGRDLDGRLELSGEASLDGWLPTSARLHVNARGFPIRQDGAVTSMLTTVATVRLDRRDGETRGRVEFESLD